MVDEQLVAELTEMMCGGGIGVANFTECKIDHRKLVVKYECQAPRNCESVCLYYRPSIGGCSLSTVDGRNTYCSYRKL